jgi:hypothetical protein
MAGALFCWLLLLLCTLDGDAADAESDFRYIPHDGKSQTLVIGCIIFSTYQQGYFSKLLGSG